MSGGIVEGRQFTGKVALVTGGGRGIGAAICEDLGRQGAHVIVNYSRSENAAQSVLAAIVERGGTGELLQGSVAEESDVLRMFDCIRSTHGKLDFLVNNAAVMRDRLLPLMSNADWRDVLETSLGGVFLCSRQAVKLMIARKSGRIVNLGSLSGVSGRAGQCNYASAKAGVIAFTRSLAAEVSAYNILVNCVIPGCIETSMFMSVPEKERRELVSNIPLKRMGKAEEIAKAVRFLLSDDASYIQGHALIVDGGLSCG